MTSERAVAERPVASNSVKRQLLDRLRQERAKWDALLAEVGEERMEILV